MICRASGALALQFLKRVSAADNATRYGSPIDDMQRTFFDIERGFSDCFAQGGMRVRGAADVFGAAAEFNYGNGFSN
jgi:hypothetical protein